MTELLVVMALYLLGAGLITLGVFMLFGAGVCLITAGGFVLLTAYAFARGIARVQAG